MNKIGQPMEAKFIGPCIPYPTIVWHNWDLEEVAGYAAAAYRNAFSMKPPMRVTAVSERSHILDQIEQKHNLRPGELLPYLEANPAEYERCEKADQRTKDVLEIGIPKNISIETQRQIMLALAKGLFRPERKFMSDDMKRMFNDAFTIDLSQLQQ